MTAHIALIIDRFVANKDRLCLTSWYVRLCSLKNIFFFWLIRCKTKTPLHFNCDVIFKFNITCWHSNVLLKSTKKIKTALPWPSGYVRTKLSSKKKITTIGLNIVLHLVKILFVTITLYEKVCQIPYRESFLKNIYYIYRSHRRIPTGDLV